MKKLLAGILMLIVLTGCTGCTGLNANVAMNVATDTAFVMAMQNNPCYKPVVLAGLNTVKTFLDGSVTYDDLIIMLAKQFEGKYAYIYVILVGYINTDKPLSETVLPMLGSYKAGIIAKVDRLIVLAKM
jgi:hypothetical protein